MDRRFHSPVRAGSLWSQFRMGRTIQGDAVEGPGERDGRNHRSGPNSGSTIELEFPNAYTSARRSGLSASRVHVFSTRP